MMKKGEVTRRLNLLAGVRPPLPGHCHLRETNLRLELSEYFEPTNAIEMLWVADIAYCSTVIEMYRVQISGFRQRILRESHAAERTPDPLAASMLDDIEPESIFSTSERADLDTLAARDFRGPRVGSVLDSSGFAILLSRMPRQALDNLRLLEQLLHEEMRERDRIINQLDRRRRQAMRDAIELAEGQQRIAAAAAGLAAPVPALLGRASDNEPLVMLESMSDLSEPNDWPDCESTAPFADDAG